MNFKIKSVILWAKDKQLPIRKIDFELDKINIITGGSEKGKSAIIAIIDYCLASSSCRIPIRKIRRLTEWFGVLIQLDNDVELLLARREPGEHQVSGEMYLKEGKNIEIPESLVSNMNTIDVKGRLNNIAKLADVSALEYESLSGIDATPSFRDLVSFVFQPQYIIANQSALFYRADSMAHREKLRSIFSYILGAVNNEYLILKEELKDIDKEIALLNREIEKQAKLVEKISGKIRGYYIQSKEYGLLSEYPYPNDNWSNERYIELLKQLPAELNKDLIPKVGVQNIAQTSTRISELTSIELELAFELGRMKHRQELLQRLIDSNRNYRDDLLDQYGRLKTSGWFMSLIKEHEEQCPLCQTKTDKAKKYIKNIVNANKGIIEKGTKLNDNLTVLITENKRINSEIAALSQRLNIVREELQLLKSNSEAENNLLHTVNSIYQFVGRVESELEVYNNYTDENDTILKLQQLIKRKDQIETIVNKDSVLNKIKRAKRKVIDNIKYYAKIFNAENNEELEDFNEKDLTLSFTSESGRLDSLYEIGSGSNYMAYHISTILGFQEYFISQKYSPIPNFIVLDQPTQVYFPETDVEITRKSEDVKKVQKIFEVLDASLNRMKGNLQIIVLEHVGTYAWEGLETIHKVKRWRDDEEDNALIPKEWFE